MKNYLERYGAARETLRVLSAVTLLFSRLCTGAAVKTVAKQHRGEIIVLRSVGAFKTLVKRNLFAKLLPHSLVASLTGLVLAAAVLILSGEKGYLQVSSNTIPFQFDLTVAAVNLILVFLLLSLSVHRLEVDL